jgi:hypothetical protein
VGCGDLRLGEIEVVTQHDALALSRGEVAERVQYFLMFFAQYGAFLG